MSRLMPKIRRLPTRSSVSGGLTSNAIRLMKRMMATIRLARIGSPGAGSRRSSGIEPRQVVEGVAQARRRGAAVEGQHVPGRAAGHDLEIPRQGRVVEALGDGVRDLAGDALGAVPPHAGVVD